MPTGLETGVRGGQRGQLLNTCVGGYLPEYLKYCEV